MKKAQFLPRAFGGRGRIVATVGAAAAAALLLASCGTPSEATGDVTITFAGADSPDAFQPVIDAFEAENPGITVEYQNIPFDQFNNVIQQRVGGGDPGIDVLYVDPPALAGQVQRGWLEDLSEFSDEADGNSLASAVASTTYDGKLYALPMWTSSQYLYYNVAALDAAGIPHPSMDPADRLTWEQLVEDAKKVQATGVEYGLLFDQTDRYYQLQALVESAGGGSGATGDDLLTPDITNEGWVKAMEWYGALFADGLAPRGVSTDQMTVLFAQGDAAFFVGGPWSANAIKTNNPDLQWGVAPHPYFEGGTAGMPTDSWALGVSAASDAKEAAKKFVEFASLTKEGNEATIEVILIPPTNPEAFDDFIPRLDEVNPPSTTGMGELTLAELSADAVFHRPASLGYAQLEEIAGRAFADIRNGLPVEETLQKAQEEIESAWSRLK